MGRSPTKNVFISYDQNTHKENKKTTFKLILHRLYNDYTLYNQMDYIIEEREITAIRKIVNICKKTFTSRKEINMLSIPVFILQLQ